MEQGKQEIVNQELTVVKFYHNDVPGPKWTPRKDDQGNEKPFEPFTKVLAVPFGSPDGTQNSEFKIKPAKFWMRGLLRNGRSFTVSIKKGVTNGYPWAHFEDLVNELMPNGDMKRIPKEEAMAGGQVTPPPPPPPAAPATPPPAAVTAPIPAPTAPAALPPKAHDYLRQALFQPQSDPWWRMKEAHNVDGMMVCKGFELAVQALGLIAPNTKVEDYEDDVIKWAGWFESAMRESKFERARQRYVNMIGMATDDKEVVEIMNMAYATLSASHYTLVRDTALERREAIKAGTAAVETFPTPETTQEGGAHGEEDDIPF